jgi:hypothetical protein
MGGAHDAHRSLWSSSLHKPARQRGFQQRSWSSFASKQQQREQSKIKSTPPQSSPALRAREEATAKALSTHVRGNDQLRALPFLCPSKARNDFTLT